jgi:hypothetical protein
MSKLAIFVEGQTEQIFTEELVYQIAGRHRVHVDTVRLTGGNIIPRQFVEMTLTGPDPSKQFYVVIYDSSNDERVLSDIRERYENLVEQGFQEVIGIRDVIPGSRSDEAIIRSDFQELSPQGAIPVTLALAVMESEAWFIAEHTHFQKMSRRNIDQSEVCRVLGYDPSAHDVQLIADPSSDLHKAYSQLAKLGYNKSREHVVRTTSNLDFERIYEEVSLRIPDLASLICRINQFLLLRR